MEIAAFDCGKPPLNTWLHRWASRSEGRSARTYAVCEGRRVVGYYSIAAASGELRSLPGRMRHGLPDPVPLMLLGRLAVDLEFAGRGIASGMLKDALSRVAAASEIAGLRALLVHAIDDEAAGFYARYGFKASPEGSLTMFLPIETIVAAATGQRES